MMTRRESYERAADRIRDELLVTLAELDRRRHQTTDLGQVARRHAPVVAGGVLAIAATLGGITFVAGRRAANRTARLREARLEALRRMWRHPDRVAVRSEDRAWPVELVKKLGLALGLAFGTQLARRAAASLLPATPRARAR